VSYKTENWREISGRMTHFIHCQAGAVPSQYSRYMLDNRAINPVVREDEQSEREAVADCSAPTIDLLILWGR